MLAASSPVRDWLSYSGKDALMRRCFGFRGASGIDGTLSLAFGLNIALGRVVLVCGDLSFLHDVNGLLISRKSIKGLIILLIDNSGGGIFNQLDMGKFYKGNIEKLFKNHDFEGFRSFWLEIDGRMGSRIKIFYMTGLVQIIVRSLAGFWTRFRRVPCVNVA